MYDTEPHQRRYILTNDPRRTGRANNFGARTLETRSGWIGLAYIPPWPTQLVADPSGKPAFFEADIEARLEAYRQIIFVLNRQLHSGTPDTLESVRIPRTTREARDGNR